MTSVPSVARKAGRIGLVCALTAYGFTYARNPAGGGLLDPVNLAIHETGHLVFAPLGETLGFLGGTVFQLVVPVAFAIYFARRREFFAATVPVWWTGQNLVGISVYVRDARAQLLPLVGGGEHDWTYLLGRWDLLHREQGIADLFHFVGVLVMVGACVAALNCLGDGAAEDPPANVAEAASRDSESLSPGERAL